MFSLFIENKVNRARIKVNPTPTPQPSSSSEESPQQPVQKAPPESPQQNPKQLLKKSEQAPKTNQVQVSYLIFKGRKLDMPNMKMWEQLGLIVITYTDGDAKVRLEVEVPNFQQERFMFDEKFMRVNGKRITVYREELNNNNQPIIIFHAIEREKTIEVYPENSQSLQAFIALKKSKGPGSIVPCPVPPESELHSNNGNEEEDDPELPKFLMPSEERLAETREFRNSIQEMKEEDKVTVLMDIFKIRKVCPAYRQQKFKCPIHSCGKQYREVHQIRIHLKNKHPELSKHGIELNEDDGSFEFSNQALDLALYLGKEHGSQMKKVIKKTKTKPN